MNLVFQSDGCAVLHTDVALSESSGIVGVSFLSFKALGILCFIIRLLSLFFLLFLFVVWLGKSLKEC